VGVKKAETWIYWATGFLCLVVPFLTSARGLPEVILLRYTATPLSVVSIVLGVASWLAATTSRLAAGIAMMWLLAAVSICLPVSGGLLSLEQLSITRDVQAAVVSVAAAGIGISSARALRGQAPMLFRGLHSGGLACLALLCARRVFVTYGLCETLGGAGLAGISSELRLFWGVVVACVATIAVGSIGGYVWRRRHEGEASVG
jgi:hypothetical protein